LFCSTSYFLPSPLISPLLRACWPTLNKLLAHCECLGVRSQLGIEVNGIAPSKLSCLTIGRSVGDFDLQPHRPEGYKRSPDRWLIEVAHAIGVLIFECA
jgi:hypothetical protein